MTMLVANEAKSVLMGFQSNVFEPKHVVLEDGSQYRISGKLRAQKHRCFLLLRKSGIETDAYQFAIDAESADEIFEELKRLCKAFDELVEMFYWSNEELQSRFSFDEWCSLNFLTPFMQNS